MTAQKNLQANEITAVHLDAVGGIAGDMFVAAFIDALPPLWPLCEQAIMAMTPPANVNASVEAHTDNILTGHRFKVTGAEPDHHAHQHGHSDHDHGHDHHHRHWRDIRARLETAELPDVTRSIAIDIFSRLAVAEADVHGIAPEDVTFHEVGAWDSIIDIVAAASIIAQLGACTWTAGSLPRGRGLVKTAHGMLPVPAPATANLLTDFILHDDGEDGERITPTGAAILAHLAPAQTADQVPRTLAATGSGFGTKQLAHRSNILRVTLYTAAPSAMRPATETVEVLRCEIDDQTPEDLAIALNKIRLHEGVLDVCQWPVFGKKGRISIAVQILTHSDHGSAISRVLFDETSTLGVRRSSAHRETLTRSSIEKDGVRVKVANRPSGFTAKAEADDVRKIDTHNARQQARHRAQSAAARDDSDAH